MAHPRPQPDRGYPAATGTGLPPDALERAGALLMAAGFLAALVAGTVGLVQDAPVTVVLAVVTLVGYGVAGWMLVTMGERSLQAAATVAALSVLFTFGLLGGEVARFVAGSFGNLIFFPLLVLLLAYAGGAIVGHAMARHVQRMDWTVRGGDQASFLLHAAAAPTVWAVFAAAHMAGPQLDAAAVALAIAAGGFVALVASAGGRLVRLGCHPRYVLGASVVTLTANAWYLLEFSGLGLRLGRDLSGAQWIALLGMLLAAFPVTFSAVALYDAELEARARAEEGDDADLDRTRWMA